MDNAERAKFWNALYNLKDDVPEHIEAVRATIKMPEYLCRYRPVTENSLRQLQENKLYYSSADYYDDPFDTFIHFDYARIKELYKIIQEGLCSGNPAFFNMVKFVESAIGMSGEEFIDNLKENELDLASLPDRIKQIRTIVQKELFSICFCESALNETLWLKYADNYKGFALVYNVNDQNTFLCGKDSVCENCQSAGEKPTVYPVYYTELAYDATKFALACLLRAEWGKVPPAVIEVSNKLVMWEAERLSLIKKKCHEYDQEWRMIRPTMIANRTCIKMKPAKIVLGLRMPEYERKLTVSAAEIAGIANIEELYINELDQLDSRALPRG